MRVVTSVKAVTVMKKITKMMSVTSVRISALVITQRLTAWMK